MKQMSSIACCSIALSVCLGLLTTTQAQTTRTNSLEALRAIHDTVATRIVADTERQKGDALVEYGKTLDTILASMKKKGDIDGYSVVEQEAKRFQADKTVLTNAPPLQIAAAVTAYRKQILVAEVDSTRRTIALLKKYIVALNDLVKDLMTRDKIEDAKTAGDARRAAENALTELTTPKSVAPPELARDTTEDRTESDVPVTQSQQTDAPLPDTKLTVGLVGFYPFNGDASDQSGLGNPAIVNGPTLTKDRFGKMNSAFQFNGINDLMTWSEPTASTWFYGKTNVALTFWIKPLRAETPKRVFVEYGMSYFGLEGTTGPRGTVEFYANNSTSKAASTTLETGVWTHFVLQITGTAKELYKNGRLVGRTPFNERIIPDAVSRTFRLGGRGDPPHFTNSCYDDVRIYNRSLSATEVRMLYNLH